MAALASLSFNLDCMHIGGHYEVRYKPEKDSVHCGVEQRQMGGTVGFPECNDSSVAIKTEPYETIYQSCK